MKKITLLFLTFLAFNLSNAQNTCATALTVSAGTTTVGTINGTDVPTPICAPNGAVPTGAAGEWYAYTPTSNGIVNLTTNLPANAGGDTRVHIYTGSCGALTCHAGNDDVDNTNYLSDIDFVVVSGTTYYIAWDNRWDSAGFDFLLTFTPYNCPSNAFPITEDFDDANKFTACYTKIDGDGNGNSWIQQFLDVDGDTVDEDFATNGSNGANAKNDWLISPPITLVNGAQYDFTFKFNGADGVNSANESLQIKIIDAPTNTANVLTTLHTQTGIVQSGTFAQIENMATTVNPSYTSTVSGTYYIAFHTTSPPNSAFLLVFDYNSTQTLGIDDYTNNTFKHFYNKDSDILTLESSNLAFDSVNMYNIIGQQVLNKNLTNTIETVDMASLKDGIYLAKVTIEGRTETLKILKQ